MTGYHHPSFNCISHLLWPGLIITRSKNKNISLRPRLAGTVLDFHFSLQCFLFLSARGVMAEGARFFLISPDFEVKRLAEFSPERLDKVEMLDMFTWRENYQFPFQIFSFSFYSLLDSSSKKYKDLARRLNLCYFRKQKKNTRDLKPLKRGGDVFFRSP